MFRRLVQWFKSRKLDIASKMVLGLSSIIAILLLSSIISVLEYRRMSNYVTDLIATNINSINISRKLANAADNYNLRVLQAIGSGVVPEELYEVNEILTTCADSLEAAVSSESAKEMADSVLLSYSDYMLTSLELEEVLNSDFIDSNVWYFDGLQPCFIKLKTDLEKFTDEIYQELNYNSENFEAGFYRSIMPGVVSIGAGIMLVLLFLVFTMIYYVRPLKKMLRGVNDYRSVNKKYSYGFEGDDELVTLNDGIREIIDENVELKRRVSRLREERDKLIETN